jgi:hypothetical protein
MSPLMSLAPAASPLQTKGIYVSDILDAVPIDKYFELFRPGAGGEGGFIRLGLDFSTDAPPPMPGASRSRTRASTGTRNALRMDGRHAAA